MGKVSALLNKAIDKFLELAPNMTLHMENKNNPHEVTKVQVGLSDVDNIKQATKSEFDSHKSEFATHVNASVLPHANGSVTTAKISNGAVTADKIGNDAVTDGKIGLRTVSDAVTGSSTFTGTLTGVLNNTANGVLKNSNGISQHLADKNNPHEVTKAQLGIENVTNNLQATKAEYGAHISGNSDRHRAQDVIFDGSISVKEQIDTLVISGGSGTFNHNELQNRDMTNQHTIGAITGLNKQLGIIFEGVTTDATETEIFADPGKYANLDGEGRLKLTRGQAYAFTLTAISATSNVSGGLASATKSWHIKGLMVHYAISPFVFIGDTIATAPPDGGELTDGMDVQVVAYDKNNPSDLDDAVKIVVTGPAAVTGQTTHWRVRLELVGIGEVDAI